MRLCFPEITPPLIRSRARQCSPSLSLAPRTGSDLVHETPREHAFCNYAIEPAAPDVVVVLDAALDPRFKNNPLVTGYPHIRFYAGAPILYTDAKYVVGAHRLWHHVHQKWCRSEARHLF